MKWLVFVLLLVVYSTALGFELNSGWDQAEIETMYFQNGVSPTPSYAGCIDSYADTGNPTNANGADTTLVVDNANYWTLLEFDISAIPSFSSTVIVEAYVELYLYGVSGSSDATLVAQRILQNWDESVVSYQKRFSHADSTWTASTGYLSDSAIATLSLFGGSNPLGYDWNIVHTTWTTREEYAGVPLSYGMDGLQHGYSGSSPSTNDAAISPGFIASTIMDTDHGPAAFQDTPRWIRIDLTKAVRAWHAGAWDNYGVLIKENSGTGDNHSYKSSEAGWEKVRPRLTVKYLSFTTGSSGSGGTGTIAGAGPTP